MDMEAIKIFGVVGAGTMGHGIAQVAARAGYRVILCDVTLRIVEAARNRIESNLSRDVSKGRLTEIGKKEVLDRIGTTDNLQALSEADFVVEAVIEDVDTKLRMFRDLDSITRPEVILATNTSSISITKIGSATKRADKVIGMHFMNPVPLMKLVEVIRGAATSDETFQAVTWIAKKMGKQPVEVNDWPGFVSNRVLMPMINEAIFALHEGVGTVEAIDEVMRLGMNHPMGPLQLADLIGLDVCLAIMNVLYHGFKDPKYRPCPLLQQYVDAGWLGRKSGRGFYIYEQGGDVTDDRR
ncbi:MAG: 3-hydroxybutyryl-CoA dehydrogenase [Acidobacteriota bacterium]|nr:3-hydroxybutyryl-CoA dehydrogenase [Blastocatellia bacterium]MDW8241047.1 3-hydroxybutyryl-CoA dehydrogenase [Acidobacteriota bacterium]